MRRRVYPLPHQLVKKVFLTSWWTGEYLPRHCHPFNAPEPPRSGVSGSAALESEGFRRAGRGSCRVATAMQFLLELQAIPAAKTAKKRFCMAKSAPWSPYMLTHRNRCACAQVSAAPGWNPKDSPGLVAPAFGSGATAFQFLLELQAIPVAKTAKKRFCKAKSAPWSPYMPPTTIKMREGCGPLALS